LQISRKVSIRTLHHYLRAGWD